MTLSSSNKTEERARTSKKQPSEGEVLAAAEAVLDYFDRGVTVRNRWKELVTPHARNKLSNERGVVAQLADEFGFGNEDDVRKILQFVSGRGRYGRGFRRSDLTRLRDLALTSCHLLRVTSLRRLMSIADGRKRMELAEEMVRERWKQPDVEAAVRAVNRGPKRDGGRKPRTPRSAREAVLDFQKLAISWRRLHEILTAADDGEQGHVAQVWREIPKGQRKKIERLAEELKAFELLVPPESDPAEG